MKILTVSDHTVPELLEHTNSKEKKVDLILSCGDLPPEYLTALRDKYEVPLYYIPGNHDIRYKQSPPLGCTNLSGKLKKHRHIRIIGLPGSRWYNGGPYQYTEQVMRRFIRKLRISLFLARGVDIIFSHAPPRHIHDQEDPCHKGFSAYSKLIDKYHPSFFIHGHIHSLFEQQSDRILLHNDTKVINSYGFFLFEI